MRKSNLCLLCASLIFCEQILADADKNTLSANIEPFKIQSRFNLRALTGDKTFAEGQLLVPLLGDSNGILYGIADGNYVKNKSNWLVGAGLGYRSVVDDYILGAYIIGDYNKTPQSNFLILNPGVEFLSSTWDFSINGYFPTDNHKILTSYWAGEDLGNYSYTRASGHNYYDHLFEVAEEPNKGFSFDVARVLPFNEDVKVHVGGYAFSTKTLGKTQGITSRVTYDLNKYSGIEAGYNYDKDRKGQFLVGLRFTLGGYSYEEKQSFGIVTRLLDPIERNEIYYVPINRYSDEGEALQHDNVWYFKEGTTSGGSGTAEDPFVGFTPTTFKSINPNIGHIDANPLMFFASGNYTFDGFKGERTDASGVVHYFQNRLVLPAGWGMYGKNSNYTSPAMDDSRPKFIGGVDILNGGSKVTELNSIYVFEDESSSDWNPKHNPISALYLVDAGTVNISNSKIENDADQAGAKTASEIVYGIFSENSTINFNALDKVNAGSNYIIAKDDPDWTTENPHSDFTIGIRSHYSTINFNGGDNHIISTSDGFFDHSDGMLSYFDNINFNGGNLEILSHAKVESDHVPSSLDYSHGIVILDGSSVYFNNLTSKINIDVGISSPGTKAVDLSGIAVDANAKNVRFYTNSELITKNNLSDILNYVNINDTGSSAGEIKGYKFIFGDMTINW